MPKWILEGLYFRFNDEQMEVQNQKMWFKARRAGWKKEDMGFYYADIEHRTWKVQGGIQ